MHTLSCTVLRTSSHRIQNFAHTDGETETGENFLLSTATPQHIPTAQVITQPHKLYSQLVRLMTAVMYQVTGLTCSFVYGMGVQSAAITHNNLAGDAHHLLLFHMQPTNQPTLMSLDLSYNKVGCPSFTETLVI